MFAIFADISGSFLVSSFSKSRILLHSLFLRFLRYLSWVFLASKKNRCYICDFSDICGDFGVLLGFFFFLSLVSCQICYSCDFCDICHGCFQLARNILVTFAIFAILADFSGLFLVSSFSKTRVLLNLLFLRFLRHLSRVFSARKKNPCYFCDFCDICGHFVALLGFFFLSLEFDPGHISDSVSQTPRYYHLRNNWKIKRYTSYASYWRLSENHFVQKTRRCLVSCCTMNTLMLEQIF